MGQAVQKILPAAGEPIGMMLPCMSVFACNALMYVFCQFKKDNSWIDVWWGISFIVPNAVLMGLQHRAG